MHVLVATEGHLEPEAVATFVGPLTGGGGAATVLTVIEVPRVMLQDLRNHFNDQLPPELMRTDIETVTARPRIDPPRSWPGDDSIIQQYLDSKKEEICTPLVDAMRSQGIEVESMLVEGKPAQGILETATSLDVDLIVIGSHGAGFFEGLLGSTGTKVIRMAKCPVLLIRNQATS